MILFDFLFITQLYELIRHAIFDVVIIILFIYSCCASLFAFLINYAATFAVLDWFIYYYYVTIPITFMIIALVADYYSYKRGDLSRYEIYPDEIDYDQGKIIKELEIKTIDETHSELDAKIRADLEDKNNS